MSSVVRCLVISRSKKLMVLFCSCVGVKVRLGFMLFRYSCIKFLHNKKRYINRQLYEAHLTGANEWNNIWNTLELNIDICLNKEMEKHYTNLNRKLDKLTMLQKKETKQTYQTTKSQFHERTVNLTTIKFDKEERTLMDKGMQYSKIGKYWNVIII